MYAIQAESKFATATPLTLSGPCGYEVRDDRIVINIAQITNHRDFGDISGSLSVELWALDRPYAGGDFSGIALCGAQIGHLYGQHFLADGHYELDFDRPPVGTWHLSLMLREWTDVGFTTRDFINFAIPYAVESKPAIIRSETDNVISVEFGNHRASPEAALARAAAEPTDDAVTSAQSDVAKQEVAIDDQAISLNSASYEQIAGVKGISKKVAENIVAARPYASLDDLVKVKGMGAKLLDRIRQFIKL